VLPEAMRDPVIYAIPVFILFMALELLSLRLLDDEEAATYAGYEARDSRTSLLMGVGSVVVNGAARVVALLGYAALFAITPLRLDPHRWYTWVFVMLAMDLIWYAYHRASHRVRIMWAAHQAHHNSQKFNYSTALRQKWNPWGELLFWVPLPLLGVTPWVIFTAWSFNLMYQFWVHTERIGRLWAPLEFVFNTPSHHRVHHSSEPQYLDRNYGGILILWDRLFGTFAAETHRPVYGLTKNIDSYNPFRLQYHEYGSIIRDVRAASTWQERLGYLFRPPGWAPASARAELNAPLVTVHGG
jgi:sterol desaturase/sphingolipid hydroxylase (fatty acid hydroxylase superfamily)